MTGDRQEAIAAHLLTTMQGVTIAAGYVLPADFQLVTREILMWEETGGRYPAICVQPEGQRSTPLEFAYTHEARVPFRVVIYFRVPSGIVPAVHALQYVTAIERAYMQDITRGGLADWTEIDETPDPLIWRDAGPSTVFEATVRGVVVYEYDPRSA